MAIEPGSSAPRTDTRNKAANVGTLQAIDLDIRKYRDLDLLKFSDQIFADLEALKDQRFNFYNGLRAASRANELRSFLAWLAAIAALLTAIATVIRIVYAGDASPIKLDIYFFSAALLAYGVMGAFSLFEKAQDTSSAYFRYLGITLAIRDLWTKLEFAFLKENLHFILGDAASESAARDRIVALAEAFCADLGKIVSDELGEWRTEFVASISELDTIAKEGGESAKNQLELAVKEYRAATTKADAAAKAAEEASQPALLNVTISGEFDGLVTVSVNNIKMMETTKKSFAIEQLVPGSAKIEAVATKNGKTVAFGKWVVLKSGVQELPLTLA